MNTILKQFTRTLCTCKPKPRGGCRPKACKKKVCPCPPTPCIEKKYTGYIKGPSGEHPHVEGGLVIWRNLSLFVFLPLIALCFYNAFGHGHVHERPEFIKYEYLHIRTKKFPWGRDTTLFHNPKLNPLPDTGYEDDNEVEGNGEDEKKCDT